VLDLGGSSRDSENAILQYVFLTVLSKEFAFGLDSKGEGKRDLEA
jgi:hypothetical protein